MPEHPSHTVRVENALASLRWKACALRPFEHTRPLPPSCRSHFSVPPCLSRVMQIMAPTKRKPLDLDTGHNTISHACLQEKRGATGTVPDREMRSWGTKWGLVPPGHEPLTLSPAAGCLPRLIGRRHIVATCQAASAEAPATRSVETQSVASLPCRSARKEPPLPVLLDQADVVDVHNAVARLRARLVAHADVHLLDRRRIQARKLAQRNFHLSPAC
jgi:hypothetical protein